jgi:hypothetical protein
MTNPKYGRYYPFCREASGIPAAGPLAAGRAPIRVRGKTSRDQARDLKARLIHESLFSAGCPPADVTSL